MKHTTLKVQGMTCQHCVKAIEKSVGKLAGVTEVAVNLANAQVDVHFDERQSDEAAIKAVIQEEGYEVV
ncbi:MAG TPA: copper chaperone CopZ [Vitreoscilla sp.]|nr:copper chaperone CopZ [Vitreoscilla sp.]